MVTTVCSTNTESSLFLFVSRYVYKLVELSKLLLNVDPGQRPAIDNVIERLESIQHMVENRV